MDGGSSDSRNANRHMRREHDHGTTTEEASGDGIGMLAASWIRRHVPPADAPFDRNEIKFADVDDSPQLRDTLTPGSSRVEPCTLSGSSLTP